VTDEVTLARKSAKSGTHARKLRSTGTKVRARVAMRGAQPGYAAFLRKRGAWRPAPHGAPAIAMKEKKPVQLADLIPPP
jgi:hypothetical protein